MAAVLFRFADLSGGTARLNGRDLAGYDPDDVRALITGCAADAHIFYASIRDNLRLARALLAGPAVLVLDELTAHLDPENRRALTCSAEPLATKSARSTAGLRQLRFSGGIRRTGQ